MTQECTYDQVFLQFTVHVRRSVIGLNCDTMDIIVIEAL